MASSRVFSLENMIQFWVTVNQHQTQSLQKFYSVLQSVQKEFRNFLNSLADPSRFSDVLFKKLISQIKILREKQIFPAELSEFIPLLINDLENGAPKIKTLIVDYVDEDEENQNDIKKTSAEKITSAHIAAFINVLERDKTDAPRQALPITVMQTGRSITPEAPAEVVVNEDIVQPKKSARQLYAEGKKHLENGDILQGQVALSLCLLLAKEEEFHPHFLASAENDKDVLAFVINFVNVNETYTAGETAAYLAAFKNAADSLQILADHKAELTKPTTDGWTSIHVAAQQNSLEAMMILTNPSYHADLNQTLPDGRTPAFIATEKNASATLNCLAERHADLTKPNDNGWAPIHIAAYKNAGAAIKVLLKPEFEVNPNQALPDGRTPAYLAAYNNNARALQLLADAKADLQKRKRINGPGPIHAAAQANAGGALEVLLNPLYQIDVNQTFGDNTTAAHLSAHEDASNALQVLARNKADFKKRRLDGLAPIHTAVERNSLKALAILLKPEFGLVDFPLPDGSTPAYLAAQYNNAAALKMLGDNGANLKKARPDGWAPIHVAATLNSVQVMQVLLEHFKLDPNQKTPLGSNPLEIALNHNFKRTEMIELLIKHGAEVTQEMILDAFIKEKKEVLDIFMKTFPQKSFAALKIFYAPTEADGSKKPTIHAIKQVVKQNHLGIIADHKPDMVIINIINKEFLRREIEAINLRANQIYSAPNREKQEKVQQEQFYLVQCAHQFEVEAQRLLPINKEMALLLIKAAIDQYEKAYKLGLEDALEPINDYKKFDDPDIQKHAEKVEIIQRPKNLAPQFFGIKAPTALETKPNPSVKNSNSSHVITKRGQR